jgi:hypothetical protein
LGRRARRFRQRRATASASDRDAPVQSTGRNRRSSPSPGTARTTRIHDRAASDNIDKFIGHADTDNDGLMETGEPVLVAAGVAPISVDRSTAATTPPARGAMLRMAGFADG